MALFSEGCRCAKGLCGLRRSTSGLGDPRGLFRLTRFREATPPSSEPPERFPSDVTHESDFYEPFAEYLVRGLEECTTAIALGGSRFGTKWGTPDVFGIFRSRESDIVKMPLEVVAAEIKTDASQLITAFGQACAYKLFAHRSYLVVPKSSQPEDVGRLDALCLIFGIGLILFDAANSRVPDLTLLIIAIPPQCVWATSVRAYVLGTDL